LNGALRAPGSLIGLVGGRLAGLTDAQPAAVELLALGEPLQPGGVGEEALVELEALGLVAAGEAGAGLAHRVYGEVVRAELPPLRSRCGAWRWPRRCGRACRSAPRRRCGSRGCCSTRAPSCRRDCGSRRPECAALSPGEPAAPGHPPDPIIAARTPD
jgi:hypothetical protein